MLSETLPNYVCLMLVTLQLMCILKNLFTGGGGFGGGGHQGEIKDYIHLFKDIEWVILGTNNWYQTKIEKNFPKISPKFFVLFPKWIRGILWDLPVRITNKNFLTGGGGFGGGGHGGGGAYGGGHQGRLQPFMIQKFVLEKYVFNYNIQLFLGGGGFGGGGHGGGGHQGGGGFGGSASNAAGMETYKVIFA